VHGRASVLWDFTLLLYYNEWKMQDAAARQKQNGGRELFSAAGEVMV